MKLLRGALASPLVLWCAVARGQARDPPLRDAPPAAAAPAPHATDSSLSWHAEWPRFRPIEYVATAILGGVALAEFTFGTPAESPRWVGPILFDAPVRDALRAEGRTLDTVREVSHVATWLPLIQVVVIDSLLVPTLRRRADVAWQLTMMNAEAFAVSGILVWTMFELVGRARPSYRECQNGTSADPLCGTGSFADFPSGHATTAFTAAGLSCVHHAHLPLWGGGAADAAGCVSALTLATGAGLLRLVGDRHYSSDVIAGAGLGFLVGFGLPSLLHYRERPLGEVYRSEAIKVGVTAGAATTPVGASVFGQF